MHVPIAKPRRGHLEEAASFGYGCGQEGGGEGDGEWSKEVAALDGREGIFVDILGGCGRG